METQSHFSMYGIIHLSVVSDGDLRPTYTYTKAFLLIGGPTYRSTYL